MRNFLCPLLALFAFAALRAEGAEALAVSTAPFTAPAASTAPARGTPAVRPRGKRRPGGRPAMKPAKAARPASARSTRRKRHRRRPQAAAAVPAGPERVPLSPGRWAPEVREALERLLAQEGKLSSGYDPEDPPTAVLILDELAGGHAPGDALLRRLVDRAAFRFTDKYWRRIPEPFGGERVRAGYNAFKDSPPAAWPKDENYAVYRKAFYRARREVCALWGARECARWKSSLLAGLSEREVRAHVREALSEALAEPVGTFAAEDFAEDPDPVVVETGLRKVPELEELSRKLAEQGFEVWVMSLSDQWSAERFAGFYGIPSTRVFGVRNEVREGTLADGIVPPIPWGQGQVELQLRDFAEPSLVLAGAEDGPLAFRAGLSVFFLEEGAPLPKKSAPRVLEDGGEARVVLRQARFKPLRPPQSTGEEEGATGP